VLISGTTAGFKISYRRSKVLGQGMVAGLTNGRGGENAEERGRPGPFPRRRPRPHHRVARSLRANNTVSVGWRELDGWKLEPGDRLRVRPTVTRWLRRVGGAAEVSSLLAEGPPPMPGLNRPSSGVAGQAPSGSPCVARDQRGLVRQGDAAISRSARPHLLQRPLVFPDGRTQAANPASMASTPWDSGKGRAPHQRAAAADVAAQAPSDAFNNESNLPGRTSIRLTTVMATSSVGRSQFVQRPGGDCGKRA